jgi:hypothetical protein
VPLLQEIPFLSTLSRSLLLFSSHISLCFAGIGIRVETNDNKEFEIDHVHRNGAAEREGNVKVGDVLDTIDGRPVNGLKVADLGVCVCMHVYVCASQLDVGARKHRSGVVFGSLVSFMV